MALEAIRGELTLAELAGIFSRKSWSTASAGPIDVEKLHAQVGKLLVERDFVSDALNNGRRLRVLTVVDDYTRQCLRLVTDTSLSGERLGRELDRIGEHRGWPLMIVSDNGTEMTLNASRVVGKAVGAVALYRTKQAAIERVVS